MIRLPLRILLVEDLETDAVLIKRKIAKIVEAPEIEVVDNLEDCKHMLINFVPDVIISDYNLPTCTGMEVLELALDIDSSVTFIFLTGTINDEELAAHTILAGGSGYILKKHMDVLDEKLEPLLKKVVFTMVAKKDIREQIRNNKIAVNQIYNYLDSLKADNKEQRENIGKIRESMGQFKTGDNDRKA
ncbi:response regulator [Salinimicrobium sp. GXAS 041]|uniref:response regulator n=1 Tax=Salinimicrobium sp. GXAS 041 TaxID=3400806 RepID=UPI003C7328D1